MRIHTRFLLLLLLSVALYALALAVLWRMGLDTSLQLEQAELQAAERSFDAIMALERARIAGAVFDYTYWDAMVEFARHRDPTWGKANIADSFPVFGIEYAWIYDVNFNRVYAMPSAKGEPPEPTAEQVRTATDRAWFSRFYERDGTGAVVEYYTAPLQPTGDAARRTPPQGWLVAARRLSSGFSTRLTEAIAGTVRLRPLPAGRPPVARADSAEQIDLARTLSDAAGAPVAVIEVAIDEPSLRVMRESLQSYNHIYLVFAAFNLALLSVFVVVWMRNPLRRVAQSLDRHDLAPVTRYLDAKHEFGTIARLIRNFFKQREALISEVQRRTLSENHLREARDLADRSSRAKADFLSVMSHELRTPLNIVIGYAAMLLDEHPRADQREPLAAMKFAAEHLLALINDVLDFSKIDAGRLVLEERPFDPAALAGTLVRAFEPQARGKALTVAAVIGADLPAHVVGDQFRLAQILSNLLSNAIKFTPSGSVTLTVESEGGDEQTACIRFRVSDTGIGIPHDKQAAVFEPFTQANSDTSRRFGGTGLGLSIVRRLVQVMGSEVEVESTPGRGSTFSFLLALPRVDGEQPAETPAVPLASVDGRRVLVVEDNVVSRQLSARLLARWGVDVEVVADGAQAVAEAARKPFDLILMDLHMSGMNGFEATARIRGDQTNPNATTPILAFTSDPTGGDVSTARAAGFTDAIRKPVDPARLRAVLDRYFGGGKATGKVDSDEG
jgi:signal transduction histidine kinase/ActR/RegA family two-component response regulator